MYLSSTGGQGESLSQKKRKFTVPFKATEVSNPPQEKDKYATIMQVYCYN